MAKFTGFMCDVCSTAENGHERPLHWLGVRMPTSSSTDTAEIKDVCSDKCLVKFARARAGTNTKPPSKAKAHNVGVMEYLASKGIVGAQAAGTIGGHARQRHEMNGGREDCLVCEFLTMRGEG